MSPSTGNMWLDPHEPIAGPPDTSVTPRLGELPPYPSLQSILRLERSSVPTRHSVPVSGAFVSDIDYIFWDAYDKMAPIEHRKTISDDQLRRRDGPGLESRHRVRNHTFGTQHRGNDRSRGTHHLGGQSDPGSVQSAAPSCPSMELFEDFPTGSCRSNHYCALEPSKDPQAEAHAEPFVEPEMLLHPDETPVSHQALILEDKKIYGGTEMVEARCVDIGISEFDATTRQSVSKALTIRDSRSFSLSGLQEKPLYDSYNFSANTQSLANTPISKTSPGSPRTSQTCEPTIASDFGDLGVALAFTIIQFFGQESRPTNTEKVKRHAVEGRERTIPTNDRWQSPIAMHNRLLHEHHDFLLAFNHPAASLALKKIVANYSRIRILLAFEESWTKHLGDLEHYQTAIDDDEPSSRNRWSDNAQFWYNNAVDSSHENGRPILVPETKSSCTFELKKPQLVCIKKRPLRLAQLEETNQHPLSPAAVTIKDLDYGKEDISVNVEPWSPITRSLKDLDHSRQCFSVRTKNLGLFPRSLSIFVAFPSSAHSTTLPAPVPCTRLKEAWFIRRSMRLHRSMRPCHFLIALGFITIVGSLAPAIWRSTNRNDISGGFSLGQYILGAGVFVIGSIVMIHSRKCTCWE